MLVDEVITRLKTDAPSLNTRITGVASWAEMTRSNSLPATTPAAFVLPLGLIGGKSDAMTGAFTQELREAIGVVIIIRTHDRAGLKALEDVQSILNEVITAIAGWAPTDETGVFTVVRGGMVSMAHGTFVYQLDFSITDQLRVFS